MFGLNAGLNFQFLNNHEDIDVFGTETDINTTIHALDIPVRFEVGYNFTDALRVFGYVGPKFVFDLSGKTKTKISTAIGEGNSESQDMFKDTDYSRFNLMLGPGVGVKFNALSLRLGYDLGLLNRYTGEANDNFKIRNNQFYVTLGYSF